MTSVIKLALESVPPGMAILGSGGRLYYRTHDEGTVLEFLFSEVGMVTLCDYSGNGMVGEHDLEVVALVADSPFPYVEGLTSGWQFCVN